MGNSWFFAVVGWSTCLFFTTSMGFQEEERVEGVVRDKRT